MSTTRAQGTLYHLHPNRQGEMLLPLNLLRSRYPELYEQHVAEYANRREALAARVEPLDCTWGDVVFLAPVHPAPLFAALARSGRDVGIARPQPVTIDAGRLVPRQCIIRLMRHGQAVTIQARATNTTICHSRP